MRSELAVIGVYEQAGARFVDQRFVTPFGEIDLAFEKDGVLILVEVKSVGDCGFAEIRLGARQKRRLINTAEFFLSYLSEVELRLALVDSRNKVQIFDEF